MPNNMFKKLNNYIIFNIRLNIKIVNNALTPLFTSFTGIDFAHYNFRAICNFTC